MGQYPTDSIQAAQSSQFYIAVGYDPRTLATSGSKGCMALQVGPNGGNVFVKQDDGITTNWDLLSAGGGGGAEKVEYRQLTNAEILAKELTLVALPITPGEVELDIVSGVDQNYGTDFTVLGQILSWNSLGLDGILEENDILVISYSV